MPTNFVTKAGLFSILVFISLTSLHSQFYRPLAKQGATWVMKGYGDFENQQLIYHIDGDTILNNLSYKNIFENGQWVGFVRDDSLARKVYGDLGSNFSDCPRDVSVTNEEILMYDFSVSIGDSLNTCHGVDIGIINYEGYHVVFNEYLRVLSLYDTVTSFPYDAILIEGIGTYAGIAFSAGISQHAGKGYSLVDYCLSEDGLCTTSTQNLIEDTEINIYPNPVSDFLKIESKKRIVSVSVYDLNGRLIIFDQKSEIALNGISSGAYLLIIECQDQFIYRSKIIKI